MRYSYFVFFFFISCCVFGQNTHLDNASDFLKKSERFFEKEKMDSSYYYAKAYYDTIKNSSSDTIIINALIQLVKITGKINENEQKQYFVKAEKKANAIKNKTHLINLYFTQGNKYFIDGNHSLALPYFLKVDSLSANHNIKNHTVIRSILKRAEISKLAFTRESSEIAYSLGKEALDEAEKINNAESIHLAYVRLADYCQLMGRFKEAKIYIDKGLKYYINKGNGHESLVSRLYLIQSAYYIDQDSITKGEESRYNAILFLEGKNNDYEMAKAKYYYGHYLRYDKKNYLKALGFLEDSRKLHQITNNVDNELYHRCLRDLAICHEMLGNFENATKYYNEAYNLNIELNKRVNRNFSRNLETKYQTEKKEQEIALLTSKNQLAQQQKRNQRNLFLGGLGITTITGLFLFIAFRNRKKTNAKLKELDKLKSKFFANISHEFRTPLTLIVDPINDALTDESISDKKRQQFLIAKQNSERLLSLVNQLLDLSKIDAGHLILHIQNGNALKIIAALSQSFSYSAKQKKISYSNNIQQTNENVWFDKDALEKIVVNLISNAVKYTPEKGLVICNSDITNNVLSLEVKNTGKGLTTEELNNIFQRFYQTNEQNQGTGIGLALVKELVELHKGSINVTSNTNEWTTFNVTLPVDKNSFKNEQFINTTSVETITNFPFKSHAQPEDDDEFVDSELPILLIVEDNADLRTLLKQTFETVYNVMTASNGAIGVELALEHIPDLIISDIMMPEKDGITLTKELKTDERSSHIPIILLTAKADVESQFEGVETGADAYITKPFDKKLLVLKAEKLIETRKNLQLRYSQEIILRPKDIAVTNIDEKFLERVQSVLDQNLVESSFSIEDFSKAVGLSRMQLHRKIKALTGLTASEFIRSQRLKLAAQLLKKSDINISQVGYTVGFNDHSYFTKCFKEAYNCTPSEYSKK